MIKNYALCAVLAAAPAFAPAATILDKLVECRIPAPQFFAALVQHHSIDLNAYSVEDSISYFHVTDTHRALNKGSGTFVHGLPVEAVFGYARGQALFERGPGTEPRDTYGVVVRDGIGNVKATLDSVGARTAQVRRIDNKTTEITCEGT